MPPEDSLWLLIWESVATVGIIGEGSELLAKWAIKRKYRKLQRGMDEGSRWLLAVLMKFIRPRLLEVETFAFALVVIGLMAEFWGGHKSQEILDRNNSRLNLEAKQLAMQVELLRSTNNIISKRVDESIQARIELETYLVGRRFENSPNSIARLKKYAGTPFAIELGSIKNDTDERRRFVKEISDVLVTANWVKQKDLNGYAPNEGIQIVFTLGHQPTPESSLAGSAADALVKELATNNIIAQTRALLQAPPNGVVIIQVGKNLDLSELRNQLLIKKLGERLMD